MFDFVRSHTRLFQFLLLILIVPAFVLTGAYQGYEAFSGRGGAVASVAGQDITQAELDLAHRRQVEMIRRQMPTVDAAMFDTPQMKRNTLDSLVRERVMSVAADKAGYITTDDRLEQTLRTDRQFEAFRKPDGSLDKDMLQQALVAQGMSIDDFVLSMRQELSSRQVQSGVAGTVFAPAVAASGALDAMFQQREAQVQRFSTKDYLAKVNPTAADIETYFKEPLHAAEFKTPEKADIEYVVLDLETLKKGVTVSDADLQEDYKANVKIYTTPEERRAAHILIKAPKEASADERSKAKARAEGLLAELNKNPSAFAETAKKNSQDAGSAEQGGDIDLFLARGDTDAAYGDALFGLKKAGDMSGVVDTKDGYYIVQLKAVRGGETRSFDSVRAEIEQRLKTARAQTRYSEAVSEFTNLVEQSDDFKALADKLKIEVRSAKGVMRTPAPDATGPLASAKFLEALFSADSLRSKRNLDPMETAANTQVSGRIVNHSPAATPPLAEVSAKVREKLVAIQAAALARKEGEARLAAIRQAPSTDLGTPVLKVSRAQANELPRPLIDAVLRAPGNALPAAAGADLGDEGYAVTRIVKIVGRDPIAADASRASAQYAQAWGAAEAQAYYASLKQRFKVKLNDVK